MDDASTVDVLAIDVAADADRRWEELEDMCRLPADLYDRLAAAGVFNQLVPKEFGGANRSPVEWFDLNIELARLSGSVGWIASQGNVVPTAAALHGDEQLRKDMLGGSDVRSTGVTTAMGEMENAGDRVELTGRWPFASGCEGAAWFAGTAMPEGSVDRADIRVVYAPAEQMIIDRDWDPVGLRGTGSHTIAARSVSCQRHQLVEFFGEPQIDHPIRVAAARFGPWQISSSVAATQLGIARRAIDEVNKIVDTKPPNPRFGALADSDAIRRTLSSVEGRWQSLHNASTDTIEAIWQRGTTHGEPTLDQRCDIAVANHLANAGSVEIISACWKVAGTSGTGRSHPLARCLRDAHPLLGHVSANDRILDLAALIRRQPLEFPIV